MNIETILKVHQLRKSGMRVEKIESHLGLTYTQVCDATRATNRAKFIFDNINDSDFFEVFGDCHDRIAALSRIRPDRQKS